MKRYSICCTSNGDYYAEECQYLEHKQPDRYHKCVEIPDSFFERRSEIENAYYSLQDEWRKFVKLQRPHGDYSGKVEQLLTDGPKNEVDR